MPAEPPALIAGRRADELPWDEAARLASLDAYAILDTPPEADFDDVAMLAADICEAPIGVVNLIAAGRQWFKAEVGIGARELPLDVSICAHAILQPGLFVVPDLSDDPRFACNPLVTQAGGLRFYAGALLETPDGLPLGTVCVLDTAPRPHGVSDRQARTLATLARHVMAMLELRRASAAAARQAERLATAERRADLAQAAGGIAVWEWSIGTGLGEVSADYRRMHGLPENDAPLRFSDLLARVHPDDRGRLVADVARGTEPGERREVEYRAFAADGAERWVRGVGQTLRDGDGAPARNVGVAFDITERKAAEERLREQARASAAEAARREADALYRAYFMNTAEALFVVGVLADGGFVIEELNPAHEATTGLRTTAIGGRRIETFLSAEDARAVRERYRRCAESGEVQAYRETLKLPAGVFHWDTVLVPVRDAAGRVVRLVGSARDVTAQVHAEEALRQSQKLETLGQQTGGVAHDFNNLLAPIVGALDMLQRRDMGGERERRLIGAAAQSAERARVLVQRLLAFARRQPLQAAPVDAAKLVRAMAELVESTTGPRISVVVDAPDGLPPAMAEANQVEMALLNLAVNARDAMPDGGTLRMSVSAEAVGAGHRSGLAPGRYVRLSVADTGTGMDAETAARAIEPFFSTKGVGRGTGLGLSMAHGLASQLGGALTIATRPGAGTNVELWLPLAGAPAADAAAEGDIAAAAPRGTALLVDDEELVRLSTADMLGELGYRVIEAADAGEALRLLEAGEPFDLLVTDHLMPGMSGSDLAVAVRAARPGVPVLLVSGYAERAGVAPDLPRLTKPFRTSELAATLGRIAPGD